jgi:hypothetical protein
MTLRFLAVAGGLLALAAGVAVRLRRARSHRITTEQISVDWLAQNRAREEQPW